jgi:hypothetical protein
LSVAYDIKIQRLPKLQKPPKKTILGDPHDRFSGWCNLHSFSRRRDRNGATKEEVTDLIGDISPRMGEHYTRHVESEVNITRAFNRLKDGT